jgi:hypothetical protein
MIMVNGAYYQIMSATPPTQTMWGGIPYNSYFVPPQAPAVVAASSAAQMTMGGYPHCQSYYPSLPTMAAASPAQMMGYGVPYQTMAAAPLHR